MLRLAVFISGIAAVGANCQVGEVVKTSYQYTDYMEKMCENWDWKFNSRVGNTQYDGSASTTDYEIHGFSHVSNGMFNYSPSSANEATQIAQAKKACNDNAACKQILLMDGQPLRFYFHETTCTAVDYPASHTNTKNDIFHKGTTTTTTCVNCPAGKTSAGGTATTCSSICPTHNGDKAACCAQDGCAYAAGNDCILESELAGNPNLCDAPSECNSIQSTQQCMGGDCTEYPATSGFAECTSFGDNIAPSVSSNLATSDSGQYTYYSGVPFEDARADCASRCYKSHQLDSDTYSVFFMIYFNGQCTCRKTSAGCTLTSRGDNKWQVYKASCASEDSATTYTATALCWEGSGSSTTLVDCDQATDSSNVNQCQPFSDNIHPTEDTALSSGVTNNYATVYTLYASSISLADARDDCAMRCYKSYEADSASFSEYMSFYGTEGSDKHCSCRKASGCGVQDEGNSNGGWYSFRVDAGGGDSTCTNFELTQQCIGDDCTTGFADCAPWDGNILPADTGTLSTSQDSVFIYYAGISYEDAKADCASLCMQSHQDDPSTYSDFIQIYKNGQCTCRKTSAGCTLNSRGNHNWRAFQVSCKQGAPAPACPTHNGDKAACCAADGCAYAAGDDCIAEGDLAGNPDLCDAPAYCGISLPDNIAISNVPNAVMKGGYTGWGGSTFLDHRNLGAGNYCDSTKSYEDSNGNCVNSLTENGVTVSKSGFDAMTGQQKALVLNNCAKRCPGRAFAFSKTQNHVCFCPTTSSFADHTHDPNYVYYMTFDHCATGGSDDSGGSPCPTHNGDKDACCAAEGCAYAAGDDCIAEAGLAGNPDLCDAAGGGGGSTCPTHNGDKAACCAADGCAYAAGNDCIAEGDLAGNPDLCDAELECAEDEHVSGGACTACPAGDINEAGDKPADGDTSCNTPPAVCDACPVPLDMKAVPVGTKVVCEDTSIHCSGEWVKYGGGCYHPTCTDTQSCCAPPAPCLENQHVSSGKCEACPVGRFKPAGDQPPKNSECWPEGSCGGDFCVDSNTVSCKNFVCDCEVGFSGVTCDRDITARGIQQMLQESRKKALPTQEEIIQRQEAIKDFARDTLKQKLKEGATVKDAIKETKIPIEPEDLPQKAQAIVRQLDKVPVVAVAPPNKDEEDTCDQGVDTAGCSMVDVDTSDELVMLSTDPEPGSWSVLTSGGQIISKQTRISDTSYSMQCWNDGWDPVTTVDTSDGAQLYECYGYVVMVASQTGICTPTICNNGNCTVDGSSYVCSCEAGWSGRHCDEASTLSQCYELDCSNYGGHKTLDHCGSTCNPSICCKYTTKSAFNAYCATLTTSADYVSNNCCHRDLCI